MPASPRGGARTPTSQRARDKDRPMRQLAPDESEHDTRALEGGGARGLATGDAVHLHHGRPRRGVLRARREQGGVRRALWARRPTGARTAGSSRPSRYSASRADPLACARISGSHCSRRRAAAGCIRPAHRAVRHCPASVESRNADLRGCGPVSPSRSLGTAHTRLHSRATAGLLRRHLPARTDRFSGRSADTGRRRMVAVMRSRSAEIATRTASSEAFRRQSAASTLGRAFAICTRSGSRSRRARSLPTASTTSSGTETRLPQRRNRKR